MSILCAPARVIASIENTYGFWILSTTSPSVTRYSRTSHLNKGHRFRALLPSHPYPIAVLSLIHLPFIFPWIIQSLAPKSLLDCILLPHKIQDASKSSSSCLARTPLPGEVSCRHISPCVSHLDTRLRPSMGYNFSAPHLRPSISSPASLLYVEPRDA